MKKSKQVNYTDEPIQIGDRVRDNFLPSIDKLVFKNVPVKETVSVSIDINKKSVAYLKKQADKKNISFSTLVRYLLEAYSERGKHTSITR